MKWALSCQVKMKLLVPAVRNLCQLSPRCPADLTMCSQSNNTQHGEARLHQKASFKQYGVVMIMMVVMTVIIAKTVEAYPLLNITARGLYEIKPAKLLLNRVQKKDSSDFFRPF